MKKTYKMQDLECAHCAAKMENAIAKLDGVNNVSINFMTQKLVLDAADERFDDIIKQAVRLCKAVEPDCEILV